MATSKLDTQTRFCSGVIDFPFQDDSEFIDPLEMVATVHAFRHYLDINADQWFFIMHDRFTEEEEEENYHLHFVAKFPKRKRISSWIVAIQRGLFWGKDRRCLISVEPVKDFPLAVQYLIHKNDLMKYQFPKEEIMTNVKPDTLESILQSDGSFVDSDRLIELCRTCACKADILLEIGMNAFMRYRCVINDIWPAFHGNLHYDPPIERPKPKFKLKA